MSHELPVAISTSTLTLSTLVIPVQGYVIDPLPLLESFQAWPISKYESGYNALLYFCCIPFGRVAAELQFGRG